ncbi:hypothetical protein [Methylocella tundrae]|nr:hypothetical protein [Methylocella tundrae]
MAATGARAEDAGLVETATFWYVHAIGLAAECPTWKVDISRAALLLKTFKISDDDYSDGGKYHDLFMKIAGTIKPKIQRAGEAAACVDAENFYGPNGSFVKWLMDRN